VSEARDYPYPLWPRVSRDEAADLRAWARSAAIEPLLRGDARFLSDRRAIEIGAPTIEDPKLGGRISVVLDDGAARSLLAIDTALATVIVDRAIGGDGEGLEGAAGVLGEVERGILAYAIARWVAGSGLRVAAVLTTDAAIAAIGSPPFVAWPIAIELGKTRGTAAYYAARASSARRATKTPGWVAELAVELSVIGGRAILAARDLGELALNDIVVLDDHSLVIRHQKIEGIVDLRGPRHLRARLDEGALRVERVDIGVAPTEGSVSSNKQVIDQLGDTPVTLTLELARFTLPLAEVAALAPGEIVRTGRKIGERVALKAGDRTIAIGELVDVEGEIGVRVLELPA
jgi:type III secretion protein Q